jgi:SAM-dependent methyltransferase
MDDKDLSEYVKRYTDRFSRFGYSPETLGWGKNSKQNVRFSVLADFALKENASILDVGCGFADLYAFLIAQNWRGRYHGIDIVPVLIDKAKELYPGLNLELKDIGKDSLTISDYVIASGVFNAKLISASNEVHIQSCIARMFELCDKAVCVDFLSSYADFQKPGSWHTSPEWIFTFAKTLSRRVLLRSDYMPFEFSLFIFKDDHIENSIFGAYK